MWTRWKRAGFTHLDYKTVGRLLEEDGLGVRKEEEALDRITDGDHTQTHHHSHAMDEGRLSAALSHALHLTVDVTVSCEPRVFDRTETPSPS